MGLLYYRGKICEEEFSMQVLLINGSNHANGCTYTALRQVADVLGHSTSQITELYYVKKDTARLSGVTGGFGI